MNGELIFPSASVVTLIACIWLFISVLLTEVLLECTRCIEYLVADVAFHPVHLQVDCVQMLSQALCTAEPLMTSMTLML